MATWQKIGITFLFLDFLALTAWAAVTGSSPEQWAALFDSPWAIQIMVDLGIAASFGVRWMWKDAKEHGLNPVPWALMVLPTGSIALLAYVLRRVWLPLPGSTARGRDERLATA